MADKLHIIFACSGDREDRRHGMVSTYNPSGMRYVDTAVSDHLLPAILSGMTRNHAPVVTSGWVDDDLFDADWRAKNPIEAANANEFAILYA